MIKKEIAVVTHFSSPYQVSLFNEIERLRPNSLKVYYLHRSHSSRSWSESIIKHEARFLGDGDLVLKEAVSDFRDSRLAVFNFYTEAPVPELLNLRVRSKQPWTFWGERAGYRNKTLGSLARRWRLQHLHSGKSPIWGIGEWAVTAYRSEFGVNRHYVNLPYFSDLSRFENGGKKANESEIVFLYSGSLSRRKGVDLLAKAFLRLARDNPQARLRIMGHGPLETRMTTVLHPVLSQVDFLGFRDWDDLPEVYSSADVLCAPSRHDGWGLVIPEGLASGLPVIGTDRMGAALEFIETGKNGWLIPGGNGNALEEALREAISLTDEKRCSLSSSARVSVQEHTLENGALRFLAAADDAMSNWHS